MPTHFASIVLLIAGGYAAIGVLVALALVVRGLARIDHAAQNSPWSFRLMILPGLAAVWPLMLVKWRRAVRNHP
jgi:hypothetical protein